MTVLPSSGVTSFGMNASVITDLLVIGRTWRGKCRAGQGSGGSVTPKPRAAAAVGPASPWHPLAAVEVSGEEPARGVTLLPVGRPAPQQVEHPARCCHQISRHGLLVEARYSATINLVL